jgi:hypothetical protein
MMNAAGGWERKAPDKEVDAASILKDLGTAPEVGGSKDHFVAASKEHEHATDYQLVMPGNFVDFLTPIMRACQSFKYGEPH